MSGVGFGRRNGGIGKYGGFLEEKGLFEEAAIVCVKCEVCCCGRQKETDHKGVKDRHPHSRQEVIETVEDCGRSKIRVNNLGRVCYNRT